MDAPTVAPTVPLSAVASEASRAAAGLRTAPAHDFTINMWQQLFPHTQRDRGLRYEAEILHAKRETQTEKLEGAPLHMAKHTQLNNCFQQVGGRDRKVTFPIKNYIFVLFPYKLFFLAS